MQPGDRIRKSAVGREALASRGVDLPAPLRTLLLMIYGDRTAAEYSEVASKLPAGRAGLQTLIDRGLVEVALPGPPTSAPPSANTTPATAASRPTETLVAPLADVSQMTATHTVNEAAQQRALYPEFVRAVSDLGLRAVMLQMKVERAMSAHDLLLLRPEVEAAIARAKGEAARQEFAKRINFLLSQ